MLSLLFINLFPQALEIILKPRYAVANPYSVEKKNFPKLAFLYSNEGRLFVVDALLGPLFRNQRSTEAASKI